MALELKWWFRLYEGFRLSLWANCKIVYKYSLVPSIKDLTMTHIVFLLAHETS